MTAQQEQDRIERIPAYRTNFLLCYLCKSKSGTSLKIDIVRERERGQSGERGSREEISGCPV